MELGLGLDQELDQKQELNLPLKQAFGETSGDIPMYSLHRIKNRWSWESMNLNQQQKRNLWKKLLEANQKYREDSGNDWNCLTSNNLVYAISLFAEELEQAIGTLLGVIENNHQDLYEDNKQGLKNRKEEFVIEARNWFHRNADSLHYNMDGNIPWPVVVRLRKDLAQWNLNTKNPFKKNIEDMIMETAREEGVDANTPEEAWKEMGGKVFTE